MCGCAYSLLRVSCLFVVCGLLVCLVLVCVCCVFLNVCRVFVVCACCSFACVVRSLFLCCVLLFGRWFCGTCLFVVCRLLCVVANCQLLAASC